VALALRSLMPSWFRYYYTLLSYIHTFVDTVLAFTELPVHSW
jgi:hypothetical protein